MSQAQLLPTDYFSDTEVIGREDHLRLHLNENPYGAPPGAIAAVHSEADNHLNCYPDSECRELLAALATHFDVPADMVAVGNGTDELVLLTSMTFLRPPGSSVAITETTFPGYLLSARSVGAEPRTVPLRDAAVPADGIAAALRDGVDLAWVCNPLNPTGTALSGPDITHLIDTAEETGAVLVLDEAYMDFAGPEHDVALAAVRSGRRVLVTRTFSKAWGLASVRVGVVMGPADLVSRIKETGSALPFNVTRSAQRAVLSALARPAYVDRVREANREARDLLCKSLESLGVEYVPSVTNFVFLATPKDHPDLAARLATEHRILVRDLTAFGLPGKLRISVGTRADVERLTTAMTEVLRS
ncbi:pyridoxal phosphate-dependent aminotransferase [Streptomyces sp. NPDC059037]|uniref:pyridoxal phosphate-dependent aminotransferase n=1 Tax=Streptomyces sp. NPDC059037 TaxID=3346710 RepID=UPI0036B08E28